MWWTPRRRELPADVLIIADRAAMSLVTESGRYQRLKWVLTGLTICLKQNRRHLRVTGSEYKSMQPSGSSPADRKCSPLNRKYIVSRVRNVSTTIGINLGGTLNRKCCRIPYSVSGQPELIHMVIWVDFVQNVEYFLPSLTNAIALHSQPESARNVPALPR